MKILLALALAAASPAPAASDLGWMAGTWEMVSGERWSEEHWSVPRGGAMIGYSRSGRGEEPSEFEHLRIERGEDGVPVYLAAPGGRAVVSFRLVESGGSNATFANPSHDFPQRIAYRREGDTMVATISAADGSRASSWTYRRRD
ncbi:DUF6265 family protein [Sphingosinicella sp. CPCC 101087]|uniref:DUF6265 family protein n=1 Tax=Sphingosinicella sp. CPCC 101087 TaxID=2497754 RepID=UPI00101BADAF|nr:DUF6265 family protein [Sphingosinicella sp. CPCC 101087]